MEDPQGHIINDGSEPVSLYTKSRIGSLSIDQYAEICHAIDSIGATDDTDRALIVASMVSQRFKIANQSGVLVDDSTVGGAKTSMDILLRDTSNGSLTEDEVDMRLNYSPENTSTLLAIGKIRNDVLAEFDAEKAIEDGGSMRIINNMAWFQRAYGAVELIKEVLVAGKKGVYNSTWQYFREKQEWLSARKSIKKLKALSPDSFSVSQRSPLIETQALLPYMDRIAEKLERNMSQIRHKRSEDVMVGSQEQQALQALHKEQRGVFDSAIAGVDEILANLEKVGLMSYFDIFSQSESANAPDLEERMFLEFSDSYNEERVRGLKKKLVYTHRDRILAFLNEMHKVCVFVSPTGSGKTRILPVLLADQSDSHCVVMTVPQIKAARDAAHSVGAFMNAGVEKRSGYITGKDQSLVSTRNSVTYCTTGVLNAVAKNNPAFNGITHILVDEIDNGGKDVELLLKNLEHAFTFRSDLRVFLVSATADAESILNVFPDAAILKLSQDNGVPRQNTTVVTMQDLSTIMNVDDNDSTFAPGITRDWKGLSRNWVLDESKISGIVRDLFSSQENARTAFWHRIFGYTPKGVLIFIPKISLVENLCRTLRGGVASEHDLKVFPVPLHGKMTPAAQEIVVSHDIVIVSRAYANLHALYLSLQEMDYTDWPSLASEYRTMSTLYRMLNSLSEDNVQGNLRRSRDSEISKRHLNFVKESAAQKVKLVLSHVLTPESVRILGESVVPTGTLSEITASIEEAVSDVLPQEEVTAFESKFPHSGSLFTVVQNLITPTKKEHLSPMYPDYASTPRDAVSASVEEQYKMTRSNGMRVSDILDAFSNDLGVPHDFVKGMNEIVLMRRDVPSTPRDDVLAVIKNDILGDNKDTYMTVSKVIVSTSIAETSLTIDNLEVVIDTGVRAKQIFTEFLNSTSLRVVPSTLDIRKQRMGRVGRQTGKRAMYIEAYHANLKAMMPENDRGTSPLDSVSPSSILLTLLDGLPVCEEGRLTSATVGGIGRSLNAVNRSRQEIYEVLSTMMYPPTRPVFELGVKELDENWMTCDGVLCPVSKLCTLLFIEPQDARAIIIGGLMGCVTPMIIAATLSSQENLFLHAKRLGSTPVHPYPEAMAFSAFPSCDALVVYDLFFNIKTAGNGVNKQGIRAYKEVVEKYRSVVETVLGPEYMQDTNSANQAVVCAACSVAYGKNIFVSVASHKSSGKTQRMVYRLLDKSRRAVYPPVWSPQSIVRTEKSGYYLGSTGYRYTETRCSAHCVFDVNPLLALVGTTEYTVSPGKISTGDVVIHVNNGPSFVMSAVNYGVVLELQKLFRRVVSSIGVLSVNDIYPRFDGLSKLMGEIVCTIRPTVE
jgi:HrpA-like RNA helicase